MAKAAHTQSIEHLKDRYDELNTEKVRLGERKARAEKDLQELKQQARVQFGTDDLKKLQAKLADMRKQNEKQKAEYQKQLDEIEQHLLKIDESIEKEE